VTDGQTWAFDYAGLPDEGAIEPPHIWIEIRGPKASAEYPCLLDSGASFSAFPLEVTDELGMDRDLLEEATIRSATGRRDVLHLKRPDQVEACLDQSTAIPIVPYFFPPEVVEGEEFESDYYILGRDFFLEVEITFRQAAEAVVVSIP
jgi:hypothetical protein